MFNKLHVGLDISDTTIEVVEVRKKGRQIQVVSLNRLELPEGIIEQGRIIDADELAMLLEETFASAMPKPIRRHELDFFLPESQVFTFVEMLSNKLRGDENYQIRTLIENKIHRSVNDLVFDYKVRHETSDGAEVLIVAVARTLVEEWKNFFADYGYKTRAFDVEVLADFRTLMPQGTDEPVCLLDIGKRTTSIAVFDAQGLAYSYAISKAGDSFNNTLAKAFNISLTEAERKKISVGLTGKGANQKISKVLEGEIDEIAAELTGTIALVEKKLAGNVSKVILLGGGSELIGLTEYLTASLSCPVSKAIPADSIIFPNSIPKGQRVFYLTALGAGMKFTDDDWRSDPGFSLVGHNNSSKSTKYKQPLRIIPVVEKDQTEDIPILLKTSAMKQKISKKPIIIAGVILLLLAWFVAFGYLAFGPGRKEETLNPISQEPQAKENDLSQVPQPPATTEEQQAPNPPAPLPPPLPVPTIEITATPTGYLNVRQGPGTNFAIITRVNPKQQFPLLEIQGDWSKIQIKAGQAGWVLSKYTKKI